jgi:hypothetical protein
MTSSKSRSEVLERLTYPARYRASCTLKAGGSPELRSPINPCPIQMALASFDVVKVNVTGLSACLNCCNLASRCCSSTGCRRVATHPDDPWEDRVVMISGVARKLTPLSP